MKPIAQKVKFSIQILAAHLFYSKILAHSACDGRAIVTAGLRRPLSLLAHQSTADYNQSINS